MNTACCAISTTVSNEEASAILNLVDGAIPNVIRTIDSIVAKKLEYAAVPLTTNIVKYELYRPMHFFKY